MEMAASKAAGKNLKMSLEDYLLLVHSRSDLNLTCHHLNQVISMHGYKKIHKVHKRVLSNAVNTLELVNPCRSTLREYISPLVTTKHDDVIADLSELNWQECCVTSIQTLSAWETNTVTPNDAVPSTNRNNRSQDSVVSNSCVVSEAPEPPPTRKSTRKRKRTAKVPDLVYIY